MRVLLYGMLRAEGRRGASAKRKNGGFSLLEMLLTVAILVILLGLSAVGVARWLHPLKITELDNAAREIYMAAENRVVLLKNSGVAPKRLENADPYPGPVTGTSADGTETPVSLRVLSNTTNTDILNDMLPVGSIDPALREGYFYILYDDSTSHVFEVFYAEKPFNKDELNALRVSRSERVEYYRADTANHRLVGHYAGGLADKISNKELPKPDVKVIIENGDELTLTVKYEVPTDSLPTGVSVTRKPKVTLKYGEKEITLLEDGGTSSYFNRLTENGSITSDASPSATYTWVLDSLAKGSGGESRQFRDLFGPADPDNPLTFGGDFTVTASLELTADDYIGSSYSAKDENNSLFAKVSHNTPTAYIENLRHLQNLDIGFSNVAGKTAAVQRADIDASVVKDNKGTVKKSSYEFQPIENWDLFGYMASVPAGTSTPYSIRNLKVTPESVGNKKNGAGLFYSVADGFQFQYVRLENSDITGKDSAGALVGITAGINLENCCIVNTKVKSDINAAGGMVGYNWGISNFKRCIVIGDLTVNSASGWADVGGLVGCRGNDGNILFESCTIGKAEEEGTITITSSGTGNAGGLVGSDSSNATFTNCQVFRAKVANGKTAGGLVGRTTNATFTNCTIGIPHVDDKDDSIILNAQDYVGGLVGDATKDNQFTGCNVTNVKLTATDYTDTSGKTTGSEVGGLLGRTHYGANFEDCTANDITAKGYMSAGGLVGTAHKVVFTNCTAKNITGSATLHAGGLIGLSPENGRLSYCEAINAKAICSKPEGSVAGGLVGKSEKNISIDHCQVYWKDDMTDLKTGNTLNYQVVAETAGGLAGEIREGGTIQNSFAATLVNGSSYAGGLVGNLPGYNATDVKVEKSYADCYIQSNINAGGLIGMKESSDFQLTLTNVYAAGFIEMKSGGMAAGLYSGWAENTTAKNAYTAMHYAGTNAIYPLAAHPQLQSTNCYWLKYPNIESITSSQGEARNYTQMGNQNSLNLGDAFTKNPETHSYRGLGTNADKTSTYYPFPGLKDMPHYGDWLKKP